MSASLDLLRRTLRGRLADKGGFTLIEVLAAFTVLATLLSVMYRGVVGLRTGSIAFDDHAIQDIVARKIFDEALAKRDLKAGTYHGVRDGRRWTIIAKSIDLSGQLPPPEPEDTDQKAGTQGQAQGAPDNSKGGSAEKDGKPNWRTQKLIVRVETKGLPLEIETIRLINLEGGR